eukprot:39862_1
MALSWVYKSNIQQKNRWIILHKPTYEIQNDWEFIRSANDIEQEVNTMDEYSFDLNEYVSMAERLFQIQEKGNDSRIMQNPISEYKESELNKPGFKNINKRNVSKKRRRHYSCKSRLARRLENRRQARKTK